MYHAQPQPVSHAEATSINTDIVVCQSFNVLWPSQMAPRTMYHAQLASINTDIVVCFCGIHRLHGGGNVPSQCAIIGTLTHVMAVDNVALGRITVRNWGSVLLRREPVSCMGTIF